jgi:transposase
VVVVVSGSAGRAIGLDVHRDFCEVAICESGRVRSAGRIETAPEVLELFARSLGPEDRVALEVTGGAWEIARILEPHVRRVVVVSPDDTGIRQARAKTDRLDARTLARLLWTGELDAVWMPDERCRLMRRRLARREQLVRSRSRAKNEIHAVLMRRLKASRRSATCSGSRDAGGWASSSCQSRRQRRWPARCATSSSSTKRSPRSSG